MFDHSEVHVSFNNNNYGAPSSSSSAAGAASSSGSSAFMGASSFGGNSAMGQMAPLAFNYVVGSSKEYVDKNVSVIISSPPSKRARASQP